MNLARLVAMVEEEVVEHQPDMKGRELQGCAFEDTVHRESTFGVCRPSSD